MKKIKIAYWAVTIIFVLAILQSGIVQLIPSEGSKELMIRLGYPLYLLPILGVTKLLGAVALIQRTFKTIKEWAYAGFAFDFVGASASGASIGDVLIVTVPLIFLAIMFLSYFLWKKVEQVKVTAPTQVTGAHQ